MLRLIIFCFISLIPLFSAPVFAAPWLQPFTAMYQQELGELTPCQSSQPNIFRVCSNKLKNDGNAPYVYHHGQPTDATVVLFHGLSDSPFYFSTIAPQIHQMGFTVVVALLPGHGKVEADDDMEDSDLNSRWTNHVNQVMEFAHTLSDNVVIGGFSTGGALATQYVLSHPNQADALLLFSGALALPESVEKFANVWGAGLLAKLLDWHYQTMGPNPYKYPRVARYAALKLFAVISDVRARLADGALLNLPIFSAHSQVDETTPIHGVKDLLSQNQGNSVRFFIDESHAVCHADLVINQEQVTRIDFDPSQVDVDEPCEVPLANPQHQQMLLALSGFLRSQSEKWNTND